MRVWKFNAFWRELKHAVSSGGGGGYKGIMECGSGVLESWRIRCMSDVCVCACECRFVPCVRDAVYFFFYFSFFEFLGVCLCLRDFTRFLSRNRTRKTLL